MVTTFQDLSRRYLASNPFVGDASAGMRLSASQISEDGSGATGAKKEIVEQCVLVDEAPAANAGRRPWSKLDATRHERPFGGPF
jgi:hypothetical protein